MRKTVPKNFTVGESLAWEKCFADYPAAEWTLTYHFRGPGQGFDATAAADGDRFVLSVSKNSTDKLSPGVYRFQAFAAKGDERVLVDSGPVEVLASLAGLEIGEEFDSRSPVKRILDALDALVEGKASRDQLEYTIGDRQLKRYSMTEVMTLREHYAKLYAQELRRENAKKGGSLVKTHRVRFGRQ